MADNPNLPPEVVNALNQMMTRIQILEQGNSNLLARATMAEMRAAQPSFMARGPEVRKPKEYNGDTRGVVLENWLFEMNNYLSLFQVTSDQNKIDLATSYLSGSAIQWWQGLGEGKPTTWQAFQEALNYQFKPVDSYELARKRIHFLHQTKSVRAFLDEFQRLRLVIGDRMTDEEAKWRFLFGLKPKIRAEVESKDIPDFNSVVVSALRVDGRQWEANRDDRWRSPDNIGITQDNGPTPMEVNAVDSKTGTNNPSRNFQRMKRDLKCFRCQGVGHTSNVCRAPAPVADPNRPQPQGRWPQINAVSGLTPPVISGKEDTIVDKGNESWQENEWAQQNQE